MTVTHNTWSNLNWAEVFRQGLLLLHGMTESASGVSQNQGCSEVEWYMGKPRTPQIHYTFGFELIFGHCALGIRNLLLSGFSVYMTAHGAPQHGSLAKINRGGEDRFSFFSFLYFEPFIVLHISLLCAWKDIAVVFRTFFCIQREPAQKWLTDSQCMLCSSRGASLALKQGSLSLLSPRGCSELQSLLHVCIGHLAAIFLPFVS